MLRHVLLALLLFPIVAYAQVEQPRPLVVMNLAAHPDDEDGNTLAYYRHHENAVAYSVIFTRGEGGQNEAGPELYERLGAIRTAETEAAARILGTQVFFLNFYDFGYSKSADETFAEWSRDRRGFWDTDDPIVSAEAGRERVTARLVYLIRKLKPDVLFTNHDTLTVGPNTQHGHHQAVGNSAYDAFALAADPSFHPEQLEEDGIDLWQPQRLFLRQWRNPNNPDVSVPVGDPCPSRVLQAAYDCTDLAVRAAGQHFSQGFDKFAARFRADSTHFRLLREAADAPPVPQGTEDLAMGLPPNPHAAMALQFEQSGGYSLINRPDGGLSIRLEPSLATPGETIVLVPEVVRGQWRSSLSVRLRGSIDTTVTVESDSRVDLRVSPNAHTTFPAHRYQYDRYAIHSTTSFQIENGARRELLLEVAPPVVIDLPPAPIRLSPGDNVIQVDVQTFDPAADSVQVGLAVIPDGGMTEVSFREYQLLTPEETQAVFRFSLPADVAPGRYRVAVQAMAGPTSAPAEPYVVIRPAAVLPAVHVAEGLRVGFVQSYGQVTENALRAMGANVTVLDSTALATSDFDDLDTIVLDIRAYLVRADLREHNDRLLQWVRRGGHLVVGYHKTFEWNPGRSGSFFDIDVVEVPDEGWAPYPLTLGRSRVTREDAPVEVLQDDHVLFQSPHTITPDDWDDWVQERGLYFPREYDERYAELLAMNDPGEDALRGGLLLADVGEGTYLYSSLVWYRQLEALNPGAWRMFANLVSLPLTDGR